MHTVPSEAATEVQPEYSLPADQISKGVVLAIMKHPANIRRLDLWPLGGLSGQSQTE